MKVSDGRFWDLKRPQTSPIKPFQEKRVPFLMATGGLRPPGTPSVAPSKMDPSDVFLYIPRSIIPPPLLAKIPEMLGWWIISPPQIFGAEGPEAGEKTSRGQAFFELSERKIVIFLQHPNKFHANFFGIAKQNFVCLIFFNSCHQILGDGYFAYTARSAKENFG